MTPESYRETAAIVRKLAQGAADPKTRDAFLEIAAEFEKRAEHVARQHSFFRRAGRP